MAVVFRRERDVGFDVLDCADLAEAIEIVAKHPNARTGRIELRPFGRSIKADAVCLDAAGLMRASSS